MDPELAPVFGVGREVAKGEKGVVCAGILTNKGVHIPVISRVDSYLKGWNPDDVNEAEYTSNVFVKELGESAATRFKTSDLPKNDKGYAHLIVESPGENGPIQTPVKFRVKYQTLTSGSFGQLKTPKEGGMGHVRWNSKIWAAYKFLVAYCTDFDVDFALDPEFERQANMKQALVAKDVESSRLNSNGYAPKDTGDRGAGKEPSNGTGSDRRAAHVRNSATTSISIKRTREGWETTGKFEADCNAPGYDVALNQCTDAIHRIQAELDRVESAPSEAEIKQAVQEVKQGLQGFLESRDVDEPFMAEEAIQSLTTWDWPLHRAGYKVLLDAFNHQMRPVLEASSDDNLWEAYPAGSVAEVAGITTAATSQMAYVRRKKPVQTVKQLE